MDGLDPVINKNTKIIILGTFPSIKTREASEQNNHKRYYINNSNQFWKIIFKILNNGIFLEEGREEFLLNRYIGLWDVIKSCDFKKVNTSLDKNIINPIYNDFDFLRKNCPQLKNIYFNGKKAEKYFCRYLKKQANENVKEWAKSCSIKVLPSTSCANTRKNKEDKWKEALENFSN